MSDGFNYQIIVEGIDKAVQQLTKLNKALGSAENSAKLQSQRMDILSARIDDIAQSYGEAASKVRNFLLSVSDATDPLYQSAELTKKIVETINRSLGQTGDIDKAIAAAAKKVGQYRQEAQLAVEVEKENAKQREQVTKVIQEQNKVVQDQVDKYKEAKKASSEWAKAENDRYNAQKRQAELQTDSAGAEQDVAQQTALEEELARTRGANDKLAEERANEKLRKYQENIEAQKKLDQEFETDSAQLHADTIQKNIDADVEWQKSLERSRKSLAKEDKQTVDEKVKMYAEMFDTLEKQEADRIKAENKQLSDNMKTYTRQTAFIEDELSKQEKVKKAALEEEIRLAKAALDLRDKLASNEGKNITAKQVQDASAGEQVLKRVAEDPATYAEAAREIDKYRGSLDKARQIKENFAKVSEFANKKVKEFTLSWQTMGRILVAQAFNEVFFGIQRGLSQSVTEARDFLNAIAEIQTIVERASVSAQEYYTVTQLIIDSSNKINFSAADTANAYYETLSNQIGDSAAEIQNFIEVSGSLAKTTRTTLENSSDAISSVINAYSLSIEEADKVSANLFALVDQGRLKLEDVANSMGNVAVPASQLGVTFEEVVSGLSAISIAGIAPHESMTLLRNLMFKMIDPTEAMVDLLESWGVASAQAAIDAFGFSGVIEKINVAALEGNEAVADFAGTIRATRAVLGLTGSNYKKYQQAIEAVSVAQVEYNKIVQEFTANPGEQFLRLQTQIKNSMLEVGIQVLDFVNTLSNMFGTTKDGNLRLASLIGLLIKLGSVALSSAAAFFLLTTAANAVGAAMAGAGVYFGTAAVAATAAAAAGEAAAISLGVAGAAAATAFAPFALGAAAIAAVVAGFVLMNKTANQTYADIEAKAIKANKEISKAFSKQTTEVLKEQADILKAKYSVALQISTERLKDLNSELKKLGADDQLENLTASYERMIKALSGGDAEQRIATVFDAAAVNQTILATNIYNTTEELRSMNSEYDNQINKLQQIYDELQNQKNSVLELAAANRINLATNITDRNISGIANPNQRASAQLSAAQEAARQAANAQDPEESKRLFEVARKYLSEAENTANQAGTLGSIEKHIQFFNSQESQLNALQEQRLKAEYDYYEQQQKVIAEKGNQLTKEQEALNYEIERRDALQQTYEFMKAYVDEYERLLTMIGTNQDLSSEQKALQARELGQTFSQGAQQFGFDPSSQAAIDNSARSAELQVAILDEQEYQKNLKLAHDRDVQIRADINTSLDAIRVTTETLAGKFQASLDTLNKSQNNLIVGGSGVANIQTPADPRLGVLNKEFRDARSTFEEGGNIVQFNETLNQLVQRLAEIAPANEQQTQANLQFMERNLEAVSLLEQSIASSNGLLVESNRELANAINSLSFSISSSPKGFARGGPIGRDTIPAWLSPGEYVVNAAAARKNFSWLQAINFSGAKGYSSGGVVNSNQSFNNVFNLSSSNPNLQTGSIVTAIRRQIAQGKATLSKRRPY